MRQITRALGIGVVALALLCGGVPSAAYVLSAEEVRRQRKVLIENVEGGQYRPGSESGPVDLDQEDFDNLVRLTTPGSPDQIEAIRALGGLGDDAKSAVADLKQLILQPDSREIRRAAGYALMGVDEKALLGTLPALSAIDPELAEDLRSMNLLRKL